METDKCEKQGCPVCISGKRKNKQCLKTTQGGTGYTITCKKCINNNIVSVYHGETSRTLYSRLVEQARGHNNKQEENPYSNMTRMSMKGKSKSMCRSPKDFSGTS